MNGLGRRVFFLVAGCCWMMAMGTGTARAGSGEDVRVAEHGDELLFELWYRPFTAPGAAREVVLALDTSRSLAGEPFEAAREFLVAVAGQLERTGVRVRLVHGDYRTARCAGAGKQAIARCLSRLEPGGSTDLEALLAAAVDLAGAAGRPASVLLVSDGRPVFGERADDALVAGVRARVRGRDIAVHTAVFGDDPDRALMAGLARSLGGAHAVAPDADAVARALGDTMITEAAIEVVVGDVVQMTGGEWDNLARADGFRVAGKLASARATIRVRGAYRGRRVERVIDIDPERAPRDPGVVRRWAEAAIARLALEDPVDEALIADIEAHYLSEPEMETDADADALAGVLGRRASIPVAAPVVVVGCGATARGDISKVMIRRVIRAHVPRLRHCHVKRAMRDRRLAGEVVLGFHIAPDGSMRDARIEKSTVGSAYLEACVLEHMGSLVFPTARHAHGRIEVHYPFEFTAAPGVAEHELIASWARSVDEHLAAGRVGHARRIIERRLREIADNRLGDDALLPLVMSERAQSVFAAELDRAAAARLALPALPMALARDLFDHYVGRADVDGVAWFESVAVDADTGAYMLGRLAAGQRERGERLARAWLERLGPAAVYEMARGRFRASESQGADGVDGVAAAARPWFPELTLELATALAAAGDTRAQVMDDVLDSARLLGRDEHALALVTQRCAGPDDEPCMDWLERLQHLPGARDRLRALSVPVVERHQTERRDSPAYSFADFELARALYFTGRTAAAVRALSEIVEQYPDEDASFRELAAGLVRLRLYDEACARIAEHVRARPHLGTDAAAYARSVYEDAWGEPAPASLCR